MWLQHKSFQKQSEISVGSSSPRNMGRYLSLAQPQMHKNSLREWNKTVFGNVFQIKDDLLAKIQHLDKKEAEEGLMDQERSEQSRLKEEFLKLQPVSKSNGGKKLSKWLQGATRPSSSIHLPMPVEPTISFQH